MARHSHWHNVQLTKGKADARRAREFSRLAKAITAAARSGGGDAGFNGSLRVAVEAARAANMPKDNIDRAIHRGTGEEGGGAVIEEMMYEGFGPGSVALLIRCLTDNRNRSVSDVRTAMSKNGGTLVGQGAVKWMFEKGEEGWMAKHPVQLSQEDQKALNGLMEALEEVEDVQEVFTNMEE